MTPQPDDIRIEAALLSLRRHRPTDHIRATLGLTQEQWHQATAKLRARLAKGGSTLVCHDNGQSLIRARDGILTKQELAELRRPERARNDLTLQQAQMLKRVIDGDTATLTIAATKNERLALGYLENNGVIQPEAGAYSLPAEIAYSLGLTNIPPRGKRKSS